VKHQVTHESGLRSHCKITLKAHMHHNLTAQSAKQNAVDEQKMHQEHKRLHLTRLHQSFPKRNQRY
jgi:acetyl-CoA carboxylase beta subunit